ncbi:MAG: dephospho-CoA kinase [Phycisphaerales bacterium JB040]
MAERVVVIGLAGGVGSGKSTVARAFEALGCVVSDSDAEARAALERADVIETVRSWWGDGVLTPEGHLDRGAIARVVFADREARSRLEGLIHPLVHEARRELIERVRAGEGAPDGGEGGVIPPGVGVVIVDAPLLFEAGIEGECDAVVFVECPREERVRRVKSGRGWSEEELERREKAQKPLDAKRSASDYIVVNDGRTPLDPRVREVLGSILASDPQRE